MIGSYSKIYALGHRELQDLFDGPVSVEEKIDGSQFSFGVDENGKPHARSRGRALDEGNVDGMFRAGWDMVHEIAPQLVPGWTYRGEYLNKPKHNTLAYDRIPKQHVMIFDVDCGGQNYLTPEERTAEALRLGFEAVPVIHYGSVQDLEQLLGYMDSVSVLGGQKIEGLVFKNHARFGTDKKCLMGKYVSERFKEIHQKDYKDRHPNRSDVLEVIVQSLRTEARWEKAVQHLRDDGRLTDEPKDIGPLMKELAQDLDAECGDHIKEQLYKWARKQVFSGVSRGFPEWYKERLAASQFEGQV